MATTQPARGMRDILPAEMRRREYVIRTIRDVYERYGFEPLETPAVENIETLTGKYGEEAGGLIFKILKRGEGAASGEADLALRYDLTVPLARVVAEYGDKLPRFFKRYQIQPVYRAERPARGRFREFYQCDVDAIGSRSLVVEAELCAAAGDALTGLGFTNFTIRLNHRAVLTGILDRAGVDSDKHTAVLTALDKLDKIGADGVRKELNNRGVADVTATRLLEFFESLDDTEGSVGWMTDELNRLNREDERTRNISPPKGHKLRAINDAMLKQLVEFIGDHEAGARGCDELRTILELTAANGADNSVQLDPSLARGLSYYTGAIMEVAHPDLAGSLGGGGRYDNLVGMFAGREIPACGFSLGLERIIVVMTERGMFPAEVEGANADVLVTMWDESATADTLALARLLRAGSIRADVYPEAGKMKNQLKYASSRGVRFVTIAGPDERGRNEVALKDLRTGEQRTISRESIVEAVRTGLEEPATN